MSRRSFLAAVGILALITAVVITALLLLIRYEPQYYTHARVTTSEQACVESHNFHVVVTGLISDINTEKQWDATFTDEEINSYLSEGFIQSGLAKQLLPDGVSEPRVVFEDDRIRLAFRLRQGLLSTVISMDMKVWLAKTEPNVVAVQLESFRAGVLPIAAHWLLESISETGRQNGIEINWYRHDGYPVALLRFQADQTHPTLVIQAVKTEKGRITIQGKSNEPGNAHAELPLPEGLLRMNGN
jgi:hypothetical protein